MNGAGVVRLALAAAAALLLSGCGGAPEREGAGGTPTGSWQLSSGAGPDGVIPTPEGRPITLLFEDDGRLGGTAACNAYGASARIDGERLELDELSQTDMACEPEAMEAERAYLDALLRVDGIRTGADTLVLSGAGVELVFEPLPPVPAAELVGTVWELDTLIEGETASTPAAPGATLLLHPDGRLEGDTGCRDFDGEYELRGGEVRLARLAMDGDVGSCPAEAARQDGLIAEVLGDGFRAEVEGERLTLTSAGAAGLVYRAGADQG